MTAALLHPTGPGEYVPSPLEAHAVLEDAAAWAAAVTPGSAVVSALAVLDPTAMTQAARVDALAALERQLAWLHARQLRVLAAMAVDPFPGSLAPELDKQVGERRRPRRSG